MTEKTRPLRDPIVAEDGSLVFRSVTTPVSFDIRGRVTIGSNKVIPVIFVPGIMGTNLRVRRDVKLPEGFPLKPGEAAWRPPNDPLQAFAESRKWKNRKPAQRQGILHPSMLEVDNTGELDVSACGLEPEVMYERGWGEIYTGVYGSLLFELQSHLEMTFRVNILKQREIRKHWLSVMECEPSRWGVRNIDAVTEAELEKYAGYQYPLYAVGYNWLQSCAVAAERLKARIAQIIEFWTKRKHACTKVILITHSMGGLVARACAKQIPDSIAGVIHGVMPANGAPVAYRRMACGTETSSPSYDLGARISSEIFADIAGQTTEETTPVMAASPGVLELLPTHLYPRPLLFARTVRTLNKKDTYQDVLGLPAGDPYDMYRDMKSWYRLIDPSLVDPAEQYKAYPGGVENMVRDAIKTAERFHKEIVSSSDEKDGKSSGASYYHPNTYAFYGSDPEHLSYSRICWRARVIPGQGGVLTAGNLSRAKILGRDPDGARNVEVEAGHRLRFEIEPQDAAGDDTVPYQSGSAPTGKVKQIFPTKGYGHQGSFEHGDMLLLTRHLIVKIVVQVFK